MTRWGCKARTAGTAARHVATAAHAHDGHAQTLAGDDGFEPTFGNPDSATEPRAQHEPDPHDISASRRRAYYVFAPKCRSFAI